MSSKTDKYISSAHDRLNKVMQELKAAILAWEPLKDSEPPDQNLVIELTGHGLYSYRGLALPLRDMLDRLASKIQKAEKDRDQVMVELKKAQREEGRTRTIILKMNEALSWYGGCAWQLQEGKRESAEIAERKLIDDKGEMANLARGGADGMNLEVRGKNFFHDCPLSKGGCKVCENGDGDGGCCWSKENDDSQSMCKKCGSRMEYNVNITEHWFECVSCGNQVFHDEEE